MYDEVVVMVRLPDDEDNTNINTIFQTKDFDCTLSLYVITYDGLLKHNDEDMEFDGDLNFYSFGYNYVAHFEEGHLQEIERVPYG